jgi:ornithine carbamoyltransferase
VNGDFLDIDLLTAEALQDILRAAEARRGHRHGADLAGQAVALLFEKPSTRTRLSFTVGVHQLGGQAITLSQHELQLGRGETIEDTARALSRYCDAITLRTGAHETLTRLAQAAAVPVINALTDRSHPCQVMADLLTIQRHFGAIEGRSVVWLGDGNNMTRSWLHAAMRFDFELRLCCPGEFALPAAEIQAAQKEGARVLVVEEPAAAVAGSDVVTTDTWVSMHQEGAEERLDRLAPYQVNEALMARAAPAAMFLHCLPAHRGEEVTEGVIDGPQSHVWDEAENRLHVQKAILLWCLDRLAA